jgi:hypothetical protein
MQELAEETPGRGLLVLGLADAAALPGALVDPAVACRVEVIEQDDLPEPMMVSGQVEELLERHIGEEAGDIDVEAGELLSGDTWGGVLEAAAGAARGRPRAGRTRPSAQYQRMGPNGPRGSRRIWSRRRWASACSGGVQRGTGRGTEGLRGGA